MKSISLLYDSILSLQASIASGEVHPAHPYLVRVYPAMSGRVETTQILSELRQLLPCAQIVGCTASGIIYQGQQYLDRDLVILDELERTPVFIQSFIWKNRAPLDVAKEIGAFLRGHSARLAHLLCGDHCPPIHMIVEALSRICPHVLLAGGVAGDVLPKDEPGFVFTGDGVVDGGLVVAALCGEELFAYAEANLSHEPISPKYRLTESDGDQWKRINDQPADQWICEQLGIQKLQRYESWQIIADNDVMVHFPMILEKHHGASRFLKYEPDVNGITQYFSSIPTGTEFRIGYISPSQCVKESFAICNAIMEQPVESLFSYTCLFRRMYLNNCAQWELSPYENNNLCGAFLMGEISPVHGHSEFLNGACCIVALAENEVYIRPNINVFQTLQRIEDDTQSLLNFVLKKQSESMSRYNEQLLDKLLVQQQSAQQQLFVDFTTGIPNYLKFKDDLRTQRFDKISMIKVENSDLLITHLGHEAYTDFVREAVAQVGSWMRHLSERALLSHYAFNDNTFFLVSDERISANHFIEIARRLFDRFRFIRLSNGDVLVNRFVVVLGQEDLIEIALNAFQANRNMQVPFLVCEKNLDSRVSTDEELKMIGVLNRALESSGVMPYFQGVYDNELQCIAKYEALMRIVDVDGVVYAPASFMSIAKKYHLYYHLSKMMMEKVFRLFAGRREIVSINLSVYDISSQDMRGLLFDMLQQVGDASNFVIEILEDEEFRDIQQLGEFISQARQYGAKIAIDDFGAGYSNLLEIASINPDYIKVDGGIVRSLHTSEMNRKIMDIIVFMGQHFQSDIIAEFVENQQIQEQVKQKKIRYSQGYYFSKPKPYNQLGLK